MCPWIGLSSVNDKKVITQLQHYYADHVEILQGIAIMNGPLWGRWGTWSHNFPNNTKMADGGHIEFRKMLIPPYCMKTFAQNLVERCNTTTRRCPRNQNWNRKLMLMMSSVEFRGQTLVVLGDYSYEIFEPTLVYSSRNRQQSRRNVLNSFITKIQNGGGCHIDFLKTSIGLSGPDCKMAFNDSRCLTQMLLQS